MPQTGNFVAVGLSIRAAAFLLCGGNYGLIHARGDVEREMRKPSALVAATRVSRIYAWEKTCRLLCTANLLQLLPKMQLREVAGRGTDIAKKGSRDQGMKRVNNWNCVVNMSKFKKKASIITLLALLPILTVALIFDSLWDSRASAAVSKLSMDIRGSWGPVLRVINEIHLPEHKITAKEYHQITPLLKPGMVLLTRMDWNATNLLLSGPFKHAAIYAGDGTVIEAVGSGVRKVDLMDFLLSKDRVRLVAPTFASRREMQNAAKFATSMVGRPYDYEFQLDNEYFYCFKLVYMSYNEARKLRKSLYPTTRDLDWQPNDFFGAPTVLASDFVDTPNWSVVYETVDQVYE